MLGGSHNFAVDREVAEKAIAAMPALPSVLRENRAFLRRAGIPTVGNVHEIAEALNPAARVVYVDIGPIAVAHSNAILAGDPHAVAVLADLRDPAAILADPAVSALLDVSEPTAVLLVATLHFVRDDQNPARILAQLRDALAPGSYVAISHASSDGQPPAGQRDAQAVYARADNEIVMRTRDEIAALLAGWEIVPPGIVPTPLWHADSGEPPATDGAQFPGYSVIARRP